jgi:hypothetical protein
LSWELELRHVAVGDARIQNKLQALVREIKKNDQLKIVTHFMNDAYSPDCATNSYLQELLKDEVVVAGVSLVSATMTVPDQVQQPTTYLELTKHRGTVGLRIDVNVTGQVNGVVYGSSIYSDDSDLNTAAVHAGVVKVGETKAVTVITKGPQKRRVSTLASSKLSQPYEMLQVHGNVKKRCENDAFQRMARKFQLHLRCRCSC